MHGTERTVWELRAIAATYRAELRRGDERNLEQFVERAIDLLDRLEPRVDDNTELRGLYKDVRAEIGGRHWSMKAPAGDDPANAPSVLCVDDDRDVADLVQAILTDEGYQVSCLYTLDDDALLRAIGRLEPDCILLDGTDKTDYGAGWLAAADVARRQRPVPVVMFSAHTGSISEAGEGRSDRAAAAHFAAIVPKPFHLDDLLVTVAGAVGRSQRFDRSEAAEAERTRALVQALSDRGATDIAPSKFREWALFRDQKSELLQLYWWQWRGVYHVGRYTDRGQLRMLGQLVDRDAAIELALPT